ncbi:hypothetical protein [Anianabacter salinae]|uniref:hypothetical protein n=1 Tax=Anianabacter salinae TaxID=2851023 RepID=UPI00225E1FD5|nr:hypothetical protein [Anianabacter salinae]MBV0913863.1 hypothetical protein [Anianabacter salinae]
MHRSSTRWIAALAVAATTAGCGFFGTPQDPNNTRIIDPGPERVQVGDTLYIRSGKRRWFGDLAGSRPDPVQTADAAPLKIEDATFTSASTGDVDVARAEAAALAFGTVARACDVDVSAAAQPVDAVGRRYTLHDTAPGTTTPRTLYVTGFRDGCPRQFTAALAQFGSLRMHEATRYSPLNESPYSATDTAYEIVKKEVCAVPHGAPCPEDRARRLDRRTVFLSVHESFGEDGAWTEMLIHDGELIAGQPI